MKCKPNQTRTYDPEGFKKRAACLCFRSELEDEVLLVSSSRYPDRWIVPGGGMEPEEEPSGAAVREVYEEAGVKGKLGRLLGVFEQNQGPKHRTYVYVLTVTEVLEDWEDSIYFERIKYVYPVMNGIVKHNSYYQERSSSYAFGHFSPVYYNDNFPSCCTTTVSVQISNLALMAFSVLL
ncbi:PREDICTED: diphosphoinositol polyphosphate phosphohydrolase 3-alpha isoform X1 [Miniopterus natalensis]|uniref:diphosphoinositol polyphosphate phosphohydrolase 3-alpha isoform X1 n=1 Tax=Miniopterus natalensis TaxID=291302 RepID=UPI0007A6A860|nr:PREDICTED: diphosphoinositol polyphosphate phosphohydrolase 3-alpha isoform X1 [Miniopterus natalensis]